MEPGGDQGLSKTCATGGGAEVCRGVSPESAVHPAGAQALGEVDGEGLYAPLAKAEAAPTVILDGRLQAGKTTATAKARS